MKIVMGMCNTRMGLLSLGIVQQTTNYSVSEKELDKMRTYIRSRPNMDCPNSISVNGGPYHEMNHGVNDVGPNIGTKTPTSPYPLVPNVTRKHYQVLKDGYNCNSRAWSTHTLGLTQ